MNPECNKKHEHPVKLGEKYRDKIHGIEGIATSYSHYLTGCDRVDLEYVKDGKVTDHWVDVTRLEAVKLTKEQKKPGGPGKSDPGPKHE